MVFAGGDTIASCIYIMMAPRRHQGTIAPRALKKNEKRSYGKCPNGNLSLEGVLRAYEAWKYAGTIGNGYSFAHIKDGANP